MTKQMEALRMLNVAFESHDGAPVREAIITQVDYRLLFEALAETSRPEGEATRLLHRIKMANIIYPSLCANNMEAYNILEEIGAFLNSIEPQSKRRPPSRHRRHECGSRKTARQNVDE